LETVIGNMKSGVAKHVLLAFAFALVIYVGGFSVIEHLRHRKGGWEIVFASDADGHPSIRVSQPSLGISNVRFRFIDERIEATDLERAVTFDDPLVTPPFGNVVFIDATFLPGTVTFDFFGHEVQLMPRVLVINKKEIAWRSDAVFDLVPQEKLPPASEKFQQRWPAGGRGP